MVKCLFSTPLRGLQGFLNSVFKLAQLPLSRHRYSSISKRAKAANITFKAQNKENILHIVIDPTGFKVHGKGE
ncbi:Mobile element protein [Candidatus Enterovibrio altilux]|uniref:Mobile element protein n=1 Tax=Candidatus Enterovibrio altilux TaxID=1927128 RepID=A0A291B8V2_9GAMM|nr:Mobile element protein [Candidatus Enterovibrio luxaltus]